MLLNVTDNRVKSIGLEMRVKEQRQSGLRDAVAESQQALEKMTTASSDNGDHARKLLNTMRSDIEDTLFGLDLSEIQEESILGQVDKIIAEFDSISHKSEEIDEGFFQISQRFSKLLEDG